MTIPAKKFLNKLITDSILSSEDAQKYEVSSLKLNMPIDIFLIKHANIDEDVILKAKADLLNIDWVDVTSIPIDPQALSLIPESIARQYQLIPYNYDVKNSVIKIAMVDPFNVSTIEFIEKKTGASVKAALSSKKDILNAIDLSYSQGLSPDIAQALEQVEPEVKTVAAEEIGQLIKEAPIAKIVTTILEYAIKGRASDVHIEALENKTIVRYRIDGMLQEKLLLPKGIHESLVSRIKILSGLKIDEKRIPQDGRFNFKLGPEEVDLRVSTLPTVHGEKVVMRLLKKTGGIPTLPDLGVRGIQLQALDEVMHKPYGIILVTGPTGSGKSTTLYSVLSMLNKPSVNIVTLEDPVEYQIQGINQVQVNPQAGLTFATGLRAFLRQDPNIILVGEIRDKETTQLALQAALTGHLVFSTLHTNDAATSIPRLIDLGGEPFLIASVLGAIIGQRIVRRLCNECKQQYEPPKEVVTNIIEILHDILPEKFRSGKEKILLFKPKGCMACNDTGYMGRIGIYEALKVTPSISKLIIQQVSGKDIEKQARLEGMIAMKQDGYLKAIEGITTIEEVIRVAEF